jgi:signal transduction histidine kinase
MQVVWIVLAGLVVGRGALWGMYACHVAAFAIGIGVDLQKAASDPWADQVVSALISAVILLLIAVVVDRSLAALRESLREATGRRDELVRTNAQLQAEIAERESVTEQLVHAQKVEAVGRLASGVAHDFNHLLSLMLGYAQRGRTADDVDGLRQAVLGMEAAAHRAAAVAQTLLNFARPQPLRMETFDAGDALHEIRPMLEQLFDPGVKMSIDIAPTTNPIVFDRAQLALAVLNIAANANHAMATDGRFRISVRAAAPAHVEMEFADNGHGMSADVRERIFEPFFTTKPSGEGTGLGLAVVSTLVKNAGGVLTVQSEPAQGTIFRIVLPRAAHASERVAAVAGA